MNFPSSRSREMTQAAPTVLWWSRSGRDYSRDRIIRQAFARLGWFIHDYKPMFSSIADIEARLRGIKKPQLVWVPSFRQRDAAAARRWARRHGVPLALDPLISAWDKQVFERCRLQEHSLQAQRLLRWESALFRNSDFLIADTVAHADFFRETHGVDASALTVIPVGAEEELFVPQDSPKRSGRMRVLFYGSFIGLQGPQFIAEAARQVPEIDWTFIGSGPLLDQCRAIVQNARHVEFISRVPYEQLASRIAEADVLLGIFGTSAKAGRVIPNKVYQALACGRPVITRMSDVHVYPDAVRRAPQQNSGITWVSAGDSAEIITAVRGLAQARHRLSQFGKAAAATYATHFSNHVIDNSLSSLLQQIVPGHTRGAENAA